MEELMNVLRNQRQSFLENREIVLKEMGTDFKKQYEEVTSQIEEKKKELLENKDLKEHEKINLRGDIMALEEERREMENQINARARHREVKDKNLQFTYVDNKKEKVNSDVVEQEKQAEVAKQEENVPVEVPKAEPKVEMTKEPEEKKMSETEKMYHQVEQEIREAKEKMEKRDDPAVKAMLKRGIAGLEEKKKALEMRMKEESAVDKAPEDVKSPETQEEPKTAEVSEPAKPKKLSNEERYDAIMEELQRAEENLKTRNDNEVQLAIKTGIEILRKEKTKLAINEIMQAQRKYNLIKSRIERAENSLKEERTTMQKAEAQEEKDVHGEMIKRKTKGIVKAENELNKIEAKIKEKLRVLMEEGNDEYVEQIIDEYIAGNSLEMSRSQKEQLSVKPIVGRLEGESVQDRMKRAIKGYVKVSDDMAKVGRKELAQSARHNLKQFGHKVKGNFVYAAQILGETQDAKNFKALWQDFKESKTGKKMRSVVKEVSQKEVVQDMMQGTKEAMDEMKQGANQKMQEMGQDAEKLVQEMKHDMKEFGRDFKTTAKAAVKGIPERMKTTAQTGWGNIAYTMQEAGKVTEPLREKMKQHEAVQKVGKVAKDVSQSKVVRETKKGVKKVLQRVKQEIKASKNIKGFARNMKNKIFKNLREYCPITINREAKSVQAVEAATKTVMTAGKQSVQSMRSAAEDSARNLILGLGDKIEGKTNEKEAIMQKRQEDLEREERCK